MTRNTLSRDQVRQAVLQAAEPGLLAFLDTGRERLGLKLTYLDTPTLRAGRRPWYWDTDWQEVGHAQP